jgi:hypothetical protein
MSEEHQGSESQHEKQDQLRNKTESTSNQSEAAPLTGIPMSASSTLSVQSFADRLSDKRLNTIQRQSLTSQIGQIAGNRYLQRVIAQTNHDIQIVDSDRNNTWATDTASNLIQRQTVPADTGAPAPTTAAAARPSLSDLVTIATSAINAEYVGAARDGLNDFESIVGGTFDFGPLMTALIGNLIWAAACFTTGGAAFAISLVGIGVGTASPAASGSVDRPAFHQQSSDQIEAIRTYLLNQIVRVTSDINQQATAQNWDDFRTRHELLLRLLQPQYISMVSGGLPTVNRAVIAQKINNDLLTKANAYGASLLHPGGGGQFIYDYNVSGHFSDSGFWPFNSRDLTPVTSWHYTRGPTELYIPQGETAAFNTFSRIPLIQPADMPFAKTVYIHSTGAAGDLIMWLNQSNNVSDAEGYGIFENFAQPPSRPASRSSPLPADPIGVSRTIISQMWSATGGGPPWVRGQDLQEALFPGRSRATR